MNTRDVILYYFVLGAFLFVIWLAITGNPTVALVLAGLSSFFATILVFKTRKA